MSSTQIFCNNMLWFEICKLLIDIALDYTAKYYLEEHKFWISGMINKLASTPYYVDLDTEFIVTKSGSLHIQMLVVSIFPAPLCLWRIGETWPTSNSPSGLTVHLFSHHCVSGLHCFSVSPSLFVAVFTQQEPYHDRSAFVWACTSFLTLISSILVRLLWL